MSKRLLLLFLLLAPRAFGAEATPVCPTSSNLVWDGSFETFLDQSAWVCHGKDSSGKTVISTFATVEPGNPTYGANFRAVTTASGRSFVWVSDRDENGNSENIARTFLPTRNAKFPVLMIWFKFTDSADFATKAALVANLDLP